MSMGSRLHREGRANPEARGECKTYLRMPGSTAFAKERRSSAERRRSGQLSGCRSFACRPSCAFCVLRKLVPVVVVIVVTVIPVTVVIAVLVAPLPVLSLLLCSSFVE